MIGALAFALLDRSLRANVDDSLLSVARAIATSSERASGPNLADTIDELLGPGFAERFFQLLDPFGRPDPRLPRSRRLTFPVSESVLRNAAAGRETFETLTAPTLPPDGIRVLTLPVIERGRLANLVQVGMPLERVAQARWRFLLVCLTLMPLALVAAALGGWFLAGRALAPVDAMVAAARHISAEDLSLRLEEDDRNDELGRLASVLNDMLARLERSFTMSRQFSADAAHELRTPLTILQGELEVGLRTATSQADSAATFGSCLEEVRRLTALIEDLLFLARADANAVTLPGEAVDLTVLVGDAVPGLQALAENAAVTLAMNLPPRAVTVRGSAALLFRVLFNLGDNAIKYAGAHQRVTIALSDDGKVAQLAVSDTGPGIPAEEQERIFDRFYRSDPARERGGTGLGLSLARSIVRLHSGDITVESTPGQGTCFHVRLPLVPAPVA